MTRHPQQARTYIEAIHHAGARPIVVVDMDAFTGDPRLNDLLRPCAAEHGLYRVDAIEAAGMIVSASSLRELACESAEGLVELGLDPILIAGHCTTATFALMLHEEMARRTGAPCALALVDPAWVDRELIAEGVEDVHAATCGASAKQHVDLPDAEAAANYLKSALEASLRKDGMDDEEVAMCVDILLERYRWWLRLLFMTEDAKIPVGARGRTYVALSTEAGRAMPASWPLQETMITVFEETFTGMLRNPQVRVFLLTAADRELV